MLNFLRRIRYWFRTNTEQAQLDEEMRLHIALRAEKLQAGGMSPEEAGQTARRRFGNQLQLRERSQQMWISQWFEDMLRDLRVGVRGLSRNAAFTAVAVLTLALGIGANTAIFSVVKAVLLAPLAYHQPDRLVAIQTLWTKTNRPGSVSGGDYPDLTAEPSPFAVSSRYAGGELPVETGGRAEYVASFGADLGFASVFQLAPVAGRLITPEEFRTKANVALVGEGFAIRHFGDANSAVGQVVHVEESALSIVGVLPSAFHFPLKAEIWFPIPWENHNRTSGNYRAIALLKPGVTADAARAHLSNVGARLQLAFPSTHKYKSFTATSLKDLLVERSRMTLWLLMGSVGLVLLVACANVANLLLARATARSREMALRTALGAGRRRLVRQMLVESSLLGLAGGVLGLLLAFAGVSALLRLAPPNLPRLDEIRVDPAALLFNLAVSLAAAVLFGLWPALSAARVDVHDALKQGGTRGVLGGGRGQWARGALVAAEVALALVLTLGAGLLFRSFLALNTVELGYRTEGRMVVTASIPARTEAQHLQAGATFERIFAALRQLPGVSAVAGVMGLPSGPFGSDGLYVVEGMHDFANAQHDKLPQAGFRLTSPGYFAAMGVPLLSGRDFNERDLYDAEPVAIVSAALMRQTFQGQNPVGRRIKCGLDRDVWMRVVGVVGDMRNDNPATPPGS
jgi:predicted permease